MSPPLVNAEDSLACTPESLAKLRQVPVRPHVGPAIRWKLMHQCGICAGHVQHRVAIVAALVDIFLAIAEHFLSMAPPKHVGALRILMLGSDVSWQVLQVTVGPYAWVRQRWGEASQLTANCCERGSSCCLCSAKEGTPDTNMIPNPLDPNACSNRARVSAPPCCRSSKLTVTSLESAPAMTLSEQSLLVQIPLVSQLNSFIFLLLPLSLPCRIVDKTVSAYAS